MYYGYFFAQKKAACLMKDKRLVLIAGDLFHQFCNTTLYLFYCFLDKQKTYKILSIGLLSSPSRTRTYDSAVNSRVLYRLSYRGLYIVLSVCERYTGLPTELSRNGVFSFLLYPQNYTLSTSFLHLSSKFSTRSSSIRFRIFWSSPRPISSSQLHTLLYFHLCPIYLVVFKGSY